MTKESELPSLTLGKYVLRYPIIGGGMSVGLAGYAYAAAIAKEGGAGTLGGVGRGLLTENRELLPPILWQSDCLALQKEIDLTREISPDGIIGVNILMAVSWSKRLIKAAIGPEGEKSKINYLVVGAGFHEDVPLWTQGHPEVALLLMASTDRSAVKMAKQWKQKHNRLPDGIIMEEPATAGGHLGASRKWINNDKVKLEYSIPRLMRDLETYDLEIPIIAAGGIWDRGDIKRMLELGAKGVQMATRFVCTPECAAPDEFKQVYLSANKEDIVLVDSPVGIPGRVIRNEFIDQLEQGEIHDACTAFCLKKCACRNDETHQTSFCIMDRLIRAFKGDIDNGLIFCGSNAWRSKEQGIVPVHQIFEELTG